jgi:putative membrane-bound dehydrogenase-like protein
VPDDLKIELAIGEPEVRQPLSLKFDSRGRMWVTQFLQYPNPAGLTAVSRDKFLRTVYDRLPAPPPKHFPGEDKITIHEDTDGDGKYDRHRDFVNGLSLISSFEFGAGGVWVLQPPYLLFYPDKNGDDQPDGDPEVHLEGFGIEDSHSIANNLRFGPDGWLYGAQGSTVTGAVRKPGEKTAVHSLGQLIWRYHPTLKKYEIFAEGGGNSFGVEIDDLGRIFSGHNGGNTRGFHYVQGGYYQKGFGKHGDLSNPYAFGYFEAMGHAAVPRFTHTFIIYGGGALPSKYDGKLFGVAPLQSHVVLSELSADRSSVKTRDIGYALESKDSWMRPVDIQVGPDGAVYVLDMYEQRIDHASHYQGRIHKESGRIWRITSRDAQSKPSPKLDLAKNSSAQLLALLDHPSRWQRLAALRELDYRRDAATAEPSLAAASTGKDDPALNHLWAYHASGAWNDSAVQTLLGSPNEWVRAWTVRLECDDGVVSTEIAKQLVDLAYRDPSVQVRSQLAASSRRLPASQGLPILAKLSARSEDAADIHLPLLIWWGIEANTETNRDAVLALFADKALWEQPLVRQHLLERLMRRFAATGKRQDLLACTKLLEQAPDRETTGKLLAGFEAAFDSRAVGVLPDELTAALSKAGDASPTLRLRRGDPAAVAEALQTIADEKSDPTKRQQLIAIFSALKKPECVPILLALVDKSRNDSLRLAALSAVQSYASPQIGGEVTRFFPGLPETLRDTAQALLASRAEWSRNLLAAVAAGKIEPAQIQEATVRKMLLHGQADIAAACRKQWGELSSASSEALRAEVDRLVLLAGETRGNPYPGKKLFAESCGKCHQLFGQGGKIGPDLTSYKRDDLRGMLLNIVHPSAEIREGFENYLARTLDGRVVSGFIADQDPQIVTLRGPDGASITLPRDEIDELRAVPVSVMPEGLLKPYTPQQIRDLLAYLRSTQPLP